ncbi:PRC-barrel domain-containing protein [Nocardioides litoris]|uniref:PRC-barrel domain-containing protein n=1 Tax=Nocardioides litoris TaxID=1926648 RepID=UPI0011218959|nr:PRC-barrel domain-containing protein [Nocardioides litoris]
MDPTRDAVRRVREAPAPLHGRVVVDPHGHRVGEVDRVVVEDGTGRVLQLVVASGGLRGLARTHRLVPADSVLGVDDRVHVSISHRTIHEGPRFDLPRQQVRG